MTWKQHLPKSVLATAVAMCVAGPPAVAIADGNGYSSDVDVEIEKTVILHKDVAYSGTVEVDGDIETDSLASATIDSVQKTVGNVGPSLDASDEEASISGDVLRDARGNIGLNTAAGDNNVQANSAALAATDEEFVFGAGQADVFAQQKSSDNIAAQGTKQTVAAAGGDALRGVHGNVGVNLAAGRNNAQQNNAALSSGSNVMASATVATDQKVKNNSHTNYPNRTPRNEASLGGNVLVDARGNIGVNVAAGSGNLQANSLALTSVRE